MHSQSSLISFICKLHVAACSQHNMLLQSLTWACHTHIMAAVLYGCLWWQKLPLRHEPGWASGGPAIETEKASVHWVPWPSAGSHMVPLWPTPPLPLPQNPFEWGKGRRGGKWGEKEGGLSWKHEGKVKSVKQTNEWEGVLYPPP